MRNPLEAANSELPKLKRELFGIIMLVVVAATLVVSWKTLELFEEKLNPMITKKVALIGEQVADDLALVSINGIPIAKVPDLEKYLQTAAKQHPEIEHIVLYRNPHHLFASEKPKRDFDLSFNISGADKLQLQIWVDQKFTQKSMQNILFDVAVLIFVGLILCIEITLSLVAFNITNPLSRFRLILLRYQAGDFSKVLRLRGNDAIASSSRVIARAVNERAQREQWEKVGSQNENLVSVEALQQRSVADVRIPLFIFVFADELQKSFMPVFVKEVGTALTFLPLDVLLGLPIMAFMAMIAIFTPLAGRWSDIYGSKKIYLFGLIPAFSGHLFCGFATDVIWIVFGRALTGFGYAMIVICCQGYIAGISESKERASGMAAFVGILMSASMAGIAIGGILVERIGYQNIFALSAVLTLLAGLIAYSLFISEDMKSREDAKRNKTSFLKILSNAKFLVTILMSAIPAKIILTGFIYFIIPLYLFSLGSSAAETARVMMIYPILVISLGPLSAWVAGRGARTFKVLVFGCFFSGIGLIIFHQDQTVLAVILMIFLMGVAHAFMKAPQINFIMEIAETEMPEQGRTSILGLLRTLERIGSVIGPLLAGALVAFFGFSNAILVIGCLISGSAVTMLCYFTKLNLNASTVSHD